MLVFKFCVDVSSLQIKNIQKTLQEKSRQINSKPVFPYFEFDVKRLPRSVYIFQSINRVSCTVKIKIVNSEPQFYCQLVTTYEILKTALAEWFIRFFQEII